VSWRMKKISLSAARRKPRAMRAPRSRNCNPDVMIADISLKQGDGIELVRDVRAHYPQLPILVLSMHDETIYAERMLSAGANGYIMKQAASEQFLVSLRRVSMAASMSPKPSATT
jgi:DNA-binding NarL/FixJ family response regulator